MSLCGLIPPAYSTYRRPAGSPIAASAASTSLRERGAKSGSGASGTTASLAGGIPSLREISCRADSETVKSRFARWTASFCFACQNVRARRPGVVSSGKSSAIASCSPTTVGTPSDGK